MRISSMQAAGRLVIFLLSACGGGGGVLEVPDARPDAEPGIEGDWDRDGFIEGEDCNDRDRGTYPGAPEPCDRRDNDCDGVVDEGWDRDHDFWSTCAGDCRDNDPQSYPGAVEVIDGFDNDCDGFVDNHTDRFDDDRDGFSEDQGDCNDDVLLGGAFINPGAMEVQQKPSGAPEGVDNDCDGLVDEALPACPSGGDSSVGMSYADALDACNFVVYSGWSDNVSDPRSRAVRDHFGMYVPRAGDDFIVLATGLAVDAQDPAFVPLQPGTEFQNRVLHPDPVAATGCSSRDPFLVYDLTDVIVRLRVPTNARAVSFDFNFMSAEFPEYVCTEFDDTFLALLDSQAFSGNISFDALGNRVSINVGFFDVCDPALGPSCTGAAELVGTGHDVDGGGTGWLTTTAPVVPGEKITLRFALFDEGDRRYDSVVLIDNLRWELDTFMCPGGSPPPCTIERRP